MPGGGGSGMLHRFLMALLLACWACTTQAFDHSAWDGLLQRHVVTLRGGQASQVDYRGLQAERTLLKGYLERLSAVRAGDFAVWPRDERLAFLINAYNAYTVELILTRYPKLKSIKELGSLLKSPWKKRFIPLLGETRSLDDIEHGMIRQPGVYDEPRIHFAVNCASVGCPALRSAAYSGDKLEAQLDVATRAFLADRTRNRFDAAGGVLNVSKIFDWYRGDFERGWRGWNALPQFFAEHADALADTPEAARALRAGGFKVEFLDYDWSLNAKE